MDASTNHRGILVLLRGEPGSGKSSVAQLFKDAEAYAADDFFDKFHNGQWQASQVGAAHRWCQHSVYNAMSRGVRVVVVHNTNTTNKEMEPYLEFAEELNYRVHVLRVESGLVVDELATRNVHNVPVETIKKMADRFQPYRKKLP